MVYQLDEDSKRLIIRGDIKQWNQLLAVRDNTACRIEKKGGQLMLDE